MPRCTGQDGPRLRGRLTVAITILAVLAMPAVANAARPAVPTGLTVTAGDGRVTLEWNDSTDLVAGDRYQIYQDGPMIADGPTESRYTVTGLENGRTYAFRVGAGGSTSRLSTERYSHWTEAVYVTPRPAPPAAPTGLVATPGDGNVTLDWSDSTDLIAGDRYQVYVDGTRVADGPTTSRYTVSGLVNGRTYSFRVSAGGSSTRPADARYGAPSTAVSAVPKAAAQLTTSYSPFPGSYFRTRIPATPAVHSRSAYWVDRLVADGKPEDLYLNDWHYPQYEASATDPEYTVTTSRYVGPQGNGKVRLPAGAKPAAGADANMGVTERSANRYWGLYGVESIDHVNRTIRARGSGTTPLDGTGVFYGESSMKMATKMGVVTPEELDAGRIDHALMVVAYCTTGAVNGSGTTRQCSSVGKPEGIPNGARLQLQISDAELAAFPAWKRTILRAMRDYGIYVAETGGGFLKADYAANTSLATKWQSWLSRNDAQPGVNASGRTLDMKSGVNWRARLRVVAP